MHKRLPVAYFYIAAPSRSSFPPPPSPPLLDLKIRSSHPLSQTNNEAFHLLQRGLGALDDKALLGCIFLKRIALFLRGLELLEDLHESRVEPKRGHLGRLVCEYWAKRG